MQALFATKLLWLCIALWRRSRPEDMWMPSDKDCAVTDQDPTHRVMHGEKEKGNSVLISYIIVGEVQNTIKVDRAVQVQGLNSKTDHIFS